MQGPEYFDTLLNTADGVFIVNPEQRIVRWNKGAERILHYSEMEVLNHNCFRVIAGRVHPDKLWCHSNCKVHSCVQKGAPPENFDLMTHNNNGEEVWLNISIVSSQKDADRLIVHLFRDITQEKRVRQAIDLFLAAIGVNGGSKSKLKPETIASKQPAGKNLPAEKPLTLSNREIEVLTLLAEGLSTKVLAEQLNISHFTARNHIQNILAKLDLHSKSQAVSFAFKKGLL
jgi:PAS domain S-box-containing protein